MASKNPYTPFIILGGAALVIFGVGFYFRKKLLNQGLLEANDSGNLANYLATDLITFHVSQLNPAYQNKFKQLIAYAQSKGYEVVPTSSYRTFARQAQLHKENPSNAPAGLSEHNYGLAMDFELHKNGKVLTKGTPDAEWLATGVPQYAKSLGFEWGGDYEGYQDAVHFGIKGFTGSQLQQMAYKQFGTTDPNKIQGNKLKLA